MHLHPSVHLKIAPQREQDLLALAERHQIPQAVLAGRRGDRGRLLIASKRLPGREGAVELR
jgi:hypothetical protein